MCAPVGAKLTASGRAGAGAMNVERRKLDGRTLRDALKAIPVCWRCGCAETLPVDSERSEIRRRFASAGDSSSPETGVDVPSVGRTLGGALSNAHGIAPRFQPHGSQGNAARCGPESGLKEAQVSITLAECGPSAALSEAAGILRPVADPRIEQWTTWLDREIRPDLHRMHLHRFAWNEVAKLIGDNNELPDSYWWEYMVDTYVTTQAVAVRRQADTTRNTASFARLLMDVRKGASAITRTYWVTLTAPEDDMDRILALRSWDEQFGGGDRLDPALPERDRATLLAAADSVKKYVNDNIAHFSPDPVARDVTLNVADVHEAMDALAELYHRYYVLLTGVNLATLTPVLQHAFRRVPTAVDA